MLGIDSDLMLGLSDDVTGVLQQRYARAEYVILPYAWTISIRSVCPLKVGSLIISSINNGCLLLLLYVFK